MGRSMNRRIGEGKREEEEKDNKKDDKKEEEEVKETKGIDNKRKEQLI